MKWITIVFLCLVGSVLLGISIESFGEAGNLVMRFVGIMSLIACFRVATQHKNTVKEK